MITCFHAHLKWNKQITPSAKPREFFTGKITITADKFREV